MRNEFWIVNCASQVSYAVRVPVIEEKPTVAREMCFADMPIHFVDGARREASATPMALGLLQVLRRGKRGARYNSSF